MPAILSPAAQRINADVAGFTHVAEPGPGQPVAATPAEILHEVLPTEHGGLTHIFTDGLVETPAGAPLHLVSTDIVKPTESTIGKLGGLVPHPTSLYPHPQPPKRGPVAEPMPNPIVPGRVTGLFQPAVARVRSFLGL